MSSPTQNRPVTILYPSPQERVNSYMAAIRLASSLRNSMDAQKAGVDTEKTAPLADSYGRHHPNIPPQPSDKSATNGGREPNLILNQTASAHFAPNTTNSGFVHSQNGKSSPSHSKSTAVTPTGATLEALKRYRGSFSPPDPPMTTGDDIKREVPKQHSGYFPPSEPPTPTNDNWTPEDTVATPLPGSDIPPGCHIHLTHTHPVLALIVCPPTKRTANPTHDLATGLLHTEGIFNSHILATRDTAVCEAPTSFEQRLACAAPRLAFSLVTLIFLLFSMVLCLTRRKHLMTGQRKYNPRQQQLDEEIGNATWPRLSEVSTEDIELQRKPPRASKIPTTNNSSEAKLREEIRTSLREYRRLNEGDSAEQYEPVAWRSRSYRAERARGGRRVQHDAGPVGVLPGLNEEVDACANCEVLK